MSEYLDRERRASSVLDLPPHNGGRMRRGWTRSEIYHEMWSR